MQTTPAPPPLPPRPAGCRKQLLHRRKRLSRRRRSHHVEAVRPHLGGQLFAGRRYAGQPSNHFLYRRAGRRIAAIQLLWRGVGGILHLLLALGQQPAKLHRAELPGRRHALHGSRLHQARPFLVPARRYVRDFPRKINHPAALTQAEGRVSETNSFIC